MTKIISRNVHTRTDRLIGRLAVYTTYEGERLTGVLQFAPNGWELRIAFPDGRWGRADTRVELV